LVGSSLPPGGYPSPLLVGIPHPSWWYIRLPACYRVVYTPPCLLPGGVCTPTMLSGWCMYPYHATRVGIFLPSCYPGGYIPPFLLPGVLYLLVCTRGVIHPSVYPGCTWWVYSSRVWYRGVHGGYTPSWVGSLPTHPGYTPPHCTSEEATSSLQSAVRWPVRRPWALVPE